MAAAAAASMAGWPPAPPLPSLSSFPPLSSYPSSFAPAASVWPRLPGSAAATVGAVASPARAALPDTPAPATAAAAPTFPQQNSLDPIPGNLNPSLLAWEG